MPISPSEFTPEITEELLRRMRGNIDEREAQDVGRARSEALSRGLAGDPFEASLTGQARATGANLRAGGEADLRYRLADLARGERLLGEGRAFESTEAEKGRQFQSMEAAANRAFQERMARLGFEAQGDAASTEARRRRQQFLLETGTKSLLGGIKSGVSGGKGGFFGGLI